ncbi:RimJ/RimL family protein N-acetyltransferase [Tahibacter aquaticus]|uniref:RimJ/RimL family protein N-acetyltransferase n=1 Tax=Tahibacter aquaticus TaxID=520092 RepID=A0A4R6Z5B7_9GAMM|nr:GNAT family N-acetyltransferase [Tahibacter aquaticus]TDR46759.1 RimJ/RimL family protein N-acetyltransferase [Tahibacter aquaticus]
MPPANRLLGQSHYLQLTSSSGGVVDLGDYRLRRFDPDDLARYAELMCDEGTRGVWAIAEQPEVYAARCAHFPLPWVAAVESRPVGVIVGIVVAHGDLCGEYSDLAVYLVSEHRGQGLGRLILSVLVTLARDYGTQPTVRTMSGDERASAVAGKCGFRVVGPDPDHPRQILWRYVVPAAIADVGE